MGKRRGRGQSWWHDKTNGVANWLGVAIVGVLVVCSVASIAALTQRTPPSAAAPTYTPSVYVGPTPTPSATAEPLFQAGAPINALVTGDSLARGNAATSPELAWVPLVEQGLEKTNPVELTRVAQSTASRGVQVQDSLATFPDGTFDLVIIEVGTNDAIHSDLPTFTADYGTLMDRVREQSPDAQLVCLSSWGPASTNKPFDALIQSACEGASGRYVQISQLYTDEKYRWANGVLPDGTAIDDNFHPNDAGHAAIAALVLQKLTGG